MLYIASLDYIWKIEGIRGLYKGLLPTVLGYLPSWSIYFVCYDAFKESAQITFGGTMSHSLIHMGSAMSAGCISTLVTAPFWVIKTRMMTQSKSTCYHYCGVKDAFKTIIKVEGFKGLYKGLLPSLLGVSHVIIQFPLYERLKVDFAAYDIKKRELHKDAVLLSSSISIMVASLCTYPHEVIRTRLQNQTTPPFKYSGLTGTCRTILREETFLGFYKGFSTNLIRTIPCSALTILTYELLCEKMNLFI
ncbi:hypothetical protein DSO57_1031505 [Entomophthora muscae]|uniref:Uncharacterized protein n=1 Tax=Entomophthora muscae TaxID=34485 RepID=A0ACC2TBP4_9FUNG|nr:hypothetical protein DSO57_1031505 [Entomophthora muscae]